MCHLCANLAGLTQGWRHSRCINHRTEHQVGLWVTTLEVDNGGPSENQTKRTHNPTVAGSNPAGPIGQEARLYRKPSTHRERTESKKPEFLEIDEAARYLDACRRVQRVSRAGLIQFPCALVGTFLLTPAHSR